MDDKISLSNYRLEKAENDLRTAELLLKNNFFAQSLNRSYYSVFHATRALFVFKDLNSKRHSGILALFNKEYINKGIISVEYYTILKSAERIRTDSDYQDFYIATKLQAEEQLENAKKFLNGIKDFINQQYLTNS